MSVFSEKSFITKEEQCRACHAPYSAELAKFLSESRKCQTLYSNCEGYHSRRVFQFHESHLLEEFITCTIFFKKFSAGTIKLSMDEDDFVKNITKEIIKQSKKYTCEVHFGVIWVYYFVYQEEKTKCLPVFKIYKNKSHGPAVYLDSFLKFYHTWDAYVDNTNLEESLLCLPRNGEYHFDGTLLNLEYVLSKSKKLKYGFTSTPRFWKTFVPFSQAFFWSWIREIESYLQNHPAIFDAVKKCWQCCQDNRDIILTVAAEVIIICLGHVNSSNVTFLQTCSKALKVIFMLMNSTSTTEDYSSLENLQPLIRKFMSSYMSVYQEARMVLELLRRSPRNWFEILHCLSSLISKCSILGSEATSRLEAAQTQDFMGNNKMISSLEQKQDISPSTSKFGDQNQQMASDGTANIKEIEKVTAHLSLLETRPLSKLSD